MAFSPNCSKKSPTGFWKTFGIEDHYRCWTTSPGSLAKYYWGSIWAMGCSGMSKIKINNVLYYSCDELNLYAYHLLYFISLFIWLVINFNSQVFNLLFWFFCWHYCLISLDNAFMKVRKEKSIHHTLNMLSLDVTKKCLVAEGWSPVFANKQVFVVIVILYFVLSFHFT